MTMIAQTMVIYTDIYRECWGFTLEEKIMRGGKMRGAECVATSGGITREIY